MKYLCLLLSISILVACKKVRGLETNKEKKIMIEKISGKWKVLEYHYNYQKGTYYPETNTWDFDFESEDYLNNTMVYTNNDSLFAEFIFEIKESDKMEISSRIQLQVYDSTNLNNSLSKNTTYFSDWRKIETDEYYLNVGVICEMILSGNNLYLNYEYNDSFFGNGTSYSYSYVLEKVN